MPRYHIKVQVDAPSDKDAQALQQQIKDCLPPASKPDVGKPEKS